MLWSASPTRVVAPKTDASGSQHSAIVYGWEENVSVERENAWSEFILLCDIVVVIVDAYMEARTLEVMPLSLQIDMHL